MSDARDPQRLAALSDDELVERVRAGSSAAQVALFERHHLALLAFCRHMLGRRAPAEAAVVESFRQALATVRKHDRPVHFSALLFAIARHRCRAAGAEGTVETLGLDPEVGRDRDLGALLAALGGLPPDQRAALLLSELGRHSHEEVATIVGYPGDKVDALLAAARTALTGAEAPGDWSCAQTRLDLAVGGGSPRREAARRHLADCAECTAFGEALRALSRSLAIVLEVVPSEGLRPPDAGPSPESGGDGPSEPPDAGPGKRFSRGAVSLGALAALAAAASVVAIGVGSSAVPTPAAVAPAAAGKAAKHGHAGTRGRAGKRARTGAAHGAGGPIARAARAARRIADAAPSN